MWAEIDDHFQKRCPGREIGAIGLPETLIFVWKLVTTSICGICVFEFLGEIFPPGKGGMHRKKRLFCLLQDFIRNHKTMIWKYVRKGQ